MGKSTDKNLKTKKKARQPNARGQGDQLRADLIEAATILLARMGPDDKFSLRAVAKKAKVAPPSVYLHFADLNQLLLAVLERLFTEQEAIRAEAEQKVIQAGGGAWEQLLARSLSLVRFGLERRGHYKVMYEGAVLLRLSNPKAAAFGRAFHIRSMELISQIITEDSLKLVSKDPDRLALLLWSGLHGIISLQINKPTFDWPEATELATQLARSLLGQLDDDKRP